MQSIWFEQGCWIFESRFVKLPAPKIWLAFSIRVALVWSSLKSGANTHPTLSSGVPKNLLHVYRPLPLLHVYCYFDGSTDSFSPKRSPMQSEKRCLPTIWSTDSFSRKRSPMQSKKRCLPTICSRCSVSLEFVSKFILLLDLS